MRTERDATMHTNLNTLTDNAFRERLRTWLAANYPQHLRRPILLRLRGEQERQWLRTLHEHGWRAPGLPHEHGGMGLSLAKQLIYKEEFDAHGVARVLDLGATLLAPVLLRYGTTEQKLHYLPRILRCDDMWCQGYSEPGAGSDLASLRTRAVRRGDAYVVNGQKTWTSHASTASHIFMLVRTGNYERKQQGITFLLADLSTPGITIRPIVNLAGDDEFCEVFFDDVEIPASNLVGEVDQGWKVAKSLLGVERLVTGSPALARQAFAYLLRLIDALGLWSRMEQDDRFCRLASDLHDTIALYEDLCAAAIAGRSLDTEYSAVKILSSELFQRIADLAMDLSAERAGFVGESTFGNWQFDLRRLYMIARPGTIYGGTSEIQRDILARSMLGPTVHQPT